MSRKSLFYEEYESLLDDFVFQGKNHLKRDEIRKAISRKLVAGLGFYMVFAIYLIAVHVTLGVMLWTPSQCRNVDPTTTENSYSPVNEGIRSEVRDYRIFEHKHSSVYSGSPNEKNLKAWDDLILPTYFPMTESELHRAGETIKNPLKLSSGKYLAATGAYHELHCVRQLRFYLYKDFHYPNMTAAEEQYLRSHLDHCLEVLREEVMCSGDTSIITFFWHDPPRPKPGSKSNARRRCVDWDRVERWSRERMVPVEESLEGGWSPRWIKGSDDRERSRIFS